MTYEQYFDEWEAKIGAFIEYKNNHEPHEPRERRDGGDLRGLPFAVKDNIAVEGFHLSCGSKLLENVMPPYTATAVKKLQAAGAAAVGKTNLDEFGMGSSTDNSAIKRTNNPWDTSRVPGGSSGGSAAAAAAGLVPFALGSDTGGSVRQPAAFCGVVGLKPTYGAVSRFGLVAYASSLECVGVVADTADRCRTVFRTIRGADPMDQTSRGATDAELAAAEKASKSKTIGVLCPEASTLEAETARGFALAKERLAALGYTLADVEAPSLKYCVPAYYTIAAAEASANLARFDGIRYGKRSGYAENPDELVDTSREAGFGPEVKLRILLGTFVLRSGFQDRYYLRAQRIRSRIREEFEALTADAAGVLMPVFPTRAFGREGDTLSPFAQKAADLYTCCANLAGLPALSFPASVEGGLPVGVQLLGRPFAEEALLDIAAAYTAAHPIGHPAGYQDFWK